MNTIPFSEEELKVVGSIPNPRGKVPYEKYNTPITDREAVKRLFARRAVWQTCCIGKEYRNFSPAVNPDNTARAIVNDATTGGGRKREEGGRDMFGIIWEYVPVAGGSMVRPGNCLADDANDLVDKVKWPDISKWDWKSSAAVNENYLKDDLFNICWFLNGWFERLISMMGFEGAVIAMIDEEQKDAVKEFFGRLTALYIEILEYYLKYFPMIDGFYIHDDWGGQKDTFFSPEVASEMIVPYMRRVTDYLHCRGKICIMHSCGQNFKQVPNYIAAGWDAWRPQLINDIEKIYELYGDKIIIAVPMRKLETETATPEEQREAACKYAARFCRPEKPSMLNSYSAAMMTPAFCAELYKQSRILYGSFSV